MSRGILIHGSSSKLNLQEAYNLAAQYLGLSDDSIYHIQANTYPDFMIVQKQVGENSIPIETARSINEFVYLMPIIGTNKVVLINNIEDMSIVAANSILKTLEESPCNVLFILTTTHLFSVLPTIRSRCIKRRVLRTIYLQDMNVAEYITGNLDSIDINIINKFIEYFSKKKTLDLNFAKQYSEHVFDFILVAIHYLYYFLIRDNIIQNSYKILRLHNILSLSQNTYPDKQNLFITAMYIVK